MATPADLALVDTNVLIYSLLQADPHHEASRALIERAQDGAVDLCVTPPVLSEFFSAITNPRQVTTPYSADEALTEIDAFLSIRGLALLPVPPDVVQRWTALVRRTPVIGPAVFDLQIAATMLGNGVRRIYTFNRADFARIAELEVMTP
jgi:predicted nucleic acid-binding protein